mmetsp:Transcript_908/g.2585  ORF Transcript_908/g.2585 Transcript_908/m.2585 type:complete len:104 (-) Transcript_908:279-590(-)
MSLRERSAKMPPASAGDAPKKKTKRRAERYGSYIFRVLKQVHPSFSISKQAMMVMESCVNDTFDRIAQEASRLMALSKKDTMTFARFSPPCASCFLVNCRNMP